MFKVKTGWLTIQFPVSFIPIKTPKLSAWKQTASPFFFMGKEIPGLKKYPLDSLKQRYEEIRNGTYTFFGRLKYTIDKEKGWHINPSSGFRYDKEEHWTKIPDLSKDAGDIKYVWEKARFSFLYDVIRYDYHFEQDCSDLVFKEIESFIDNNPINKGPQYKCSQEISLRILNWTFALYYYKDSANLTDSLFTKVLKSIYAQLHHVYSNIHFSRISVRNNHAITETLMLYLSGLLFPFLPNVEKWSRDGKKWFEQEIAYQIYEDGTFLQFSMNYQRVVVQLLTWAIRLAHLSGQKFAPVVYERARGSLQFLDVCIDPVTGKLPNYGANDGALFFRLNEDDYRVYTSQLNDLRMVLDGKATQDGESIHWYGFKKAKQTDISIQGTYSFNNGGYYILQQGTVKTFIRCGKYKDRPSQSDNLHLDIWVDGMNYLWDAGSYKYNTEDCLLHYFNGVNGHNTVALSDHDQMLKGGRFIWFYWVKQAYARWEENKDNFSFTGRIVAFRQLKKNGYTHSRRIIKQKKELRWVVYDEIIHNGREELTAFWHVNPAIEKMIEIKSWDENGKCLNITREEKWNSSYYGAKDISTRFSFKTRTNAIKTEITIAQ